MTAADFTDLELVQQARIVELEAHLAEMEKTYDKVAADLIDALDVASAYRATASTLHQEVERRNGQDRRTSQMVRHVPDRRKSWPR